MKVTKLIAGGGYVVNLDAWDGYTARTYHIHRREFADRGPWVVCRAKWNRDRGWYPVAYLEHEFDTKAEAINFIKLRSKR